MEKEEEKEKEEDEEKEEEERCFLVDGRLIVRIFSRTCFELSIFFIFHRNVIFTKERNGPQAKFFSIKFEFDCSLPFVS